MNLIVPSKTAMRRGGKIAGKGMLPGILKIAQAGGEQVPIGPLKLTYRKISKTRVINLCALLSPGKELTQWERDPHKTQVP